jgi:hypothetical protein
VRESESRGGREEKKKARKREGEREREREREKREMINTCKVSREIVPRP